MSRTSCTEPQCLYKGALYLSLPCTILKIVKIEAGVLSSKLYTNSHFHCLIIVGSAAFWVLFQRSKQYKGWCKTLRWKECKACVHFALYGGASSCWWAIPRKISFVLPLRQQLGGRRFLVHVKIKISSSRILANAGAKFIPRINFFNSGGDRAYATMSSGIMAKINILR